MATDYDVILIGAGHNGLITAAYLVQAGYRVGMFERREIVGGAVATQELFPGYRIDLGGSAHILIRLTPVAEELVLSDYGLEYLDLDPLFFAPYPDGDTLFIYRDVTRTAGHLEQKFPGEGTAYQQFVADWLPFARMVKETFLQSPGPFELGRTMFSQDGLPDWKKTLSTLVQPYGAVVDRYFSEEKVKAPLVWMAGQSGPPPTKWFTAPFLLWHPLYHEGGVARPRGGSGMLTQALKRHVAAHGGGVHTAAPVQEILVEDRRAVGVRVRGEHYTSRAVVSGTHAMETFGKLLPEAHRPRRARRMRAGNGFGVMLRLALDAPVRYAAHPGDEARVGLQLLCRDRGQLRRAYEDFREERPAQDPPLVAMTFSAVDESLCPAGGEVLWLWGQYFPYDLARGTWEERGPEIADRLIDAFETYAPGTREKIVGRLFQHPRWLERELGLYRGNVMHLEMTLDQMFFGRPFLGMASYRTHLGGLYLTGASTHPGGGIMGASGRNTARIVLEDLSRKRV